MKRLVCIVILRWHFVSVPCTRVSALIRLSHRLKLIIQGAGDFIGIAFVWLVLRRLADR
jgi:hypothetical protein